MREHVFFPPAKGLFDAADQEDQRRFDEMILKVCEDPGLGARVSTLEDALPGVVFRYTEGIYHVINDLPDEATVRIWAVGRGPG